ncbi:hypothetical protein K505DRAFT_371943 [Melanomma pulvis-pyrius CBS 109.77]|uniref:F-box domain-containing protein n=1 Tax=Melanomma pulvis-pyrius CBS 109.77 TaxID=1314802 RepID=A0A6A6XQC2_9PLEO|nr:hypothetical protein K505DRAFT_371943 [Melanomma pulvis-pyrius CBS 109.77]
MADFKSKLKTVFDSLRPSTPDVIAKPQPPTGSIYSLHPWDATPSIFNTLPQELLDEIASHLPLHSIANLALTNRHMLFGMSYADPFTQLRDPSNAYERAEFLRNYEEDYPELFICHACGVFHPRRVTMHSVFSPYTKMYKCEFHDKKFRQELFLRHKRCSWLTFHMVMRAYRYTPQYGNPYILNHFEKEISYIRPWSCHTLALPSNGHLLLRERWSHGLHGVKKNKLQFLLFRRACPHTHITGLERDMQIDMEKLIDQVRMHPQKYVATGLKSEPYQCRECPTEVTIDIKPTSLFQGPTTKTQRGFPFVLSITRYMDVGECKSPHEREWETQTVQFIHCKIYWRFCTQRGNKSPPTLGPTYREHREPISVQFERQLLNSSLPSTLDMSTARIPVQAARRVSDSFRHSVEDIQEVTG